MKFYGYVGLALMAIAIVDFFFPIQPIALWYIPIIWYGYIFFIDSVVYKIKKRSLLANYPKEFLFVVLVSLPFWLIFEFYNHFTGSWIYTNYVWYVHIVDFTIIMPAIIENFMFINALGIFNRFKSKLNITKCTAWIIFVFGLISLLIPVLFPTYGYPLMWLCILLTIEPLNLLFLKSGVVYNIVKGRIGFFYSCLTAGILTGFFWEMWNFFAYPKWTYVIPVLGSFPKLFAMPLPGYLGYLPFALGVLAFYIFFRKPFFKYPSPVFN
jgi:hypothetical protein